MAYFYTGIGKAVRGGIPPYPTITVFGAELNAPDISTLRAPLHIVDPTAVFDLSSIKPNHEVCIAIVGADFAPPGTYTAAFRWYNQRTRELLFSASVPITISAQSAIAWGSWIGWVPWEISENGEYRVDISVSGPEQYQQVIIFSAVGIPVEVPAPVPAGNFFDALRDWFIWATNVLVAVATQCYVSPLLPDFIGDAFKLLSDFTSAVAGVLYDASTWYNKLDLIPPLVDELRTWRLAISDWIVYLSAIVPWWKEWADNVASIVEGWWKTAQDTVKGWITAATVGLGDMLAAWGVFVADVLPNLVSGKQLYDVWLSVLQYVDAMIDAAFKARDSLWAGWATLRDTVAEFFASPLDWLWARFTDWFLGPEV